MECIAPGFRFHPTDEELIVYYLKRKICRKKLRVNAIGETDVYKYDPQDLPGKALYKSRDRQWFFFSLRDKKCGGRASRGTENGYWKATGNDKEVFCNSRLVGMRKTLVFHRGKAPKGERTDWVMHEYSLVEEELKNLENVKGYYVVNKVFKKSGSGPKNGAQYGAPFIEEEWVDDDDDDVEDVIESADVDVSANQLTVPAEMDNTFVNGLSQSELDGYDIEDLMRQVREEPSHVGLSVAPTLQLDELSPVETFNPTNLSRDAYLEIDDLLLSGPESGSVEAVPENWDLDVSDDVANNRFFDVDSFFLDMDAADPNSISDPQSEPVRVGLADGVEQQPQVDASPVTDQTTNDQVQQQTVANQASESPLANSVAMSSRMWIQELNNDVITDTQFIEKPSTVPGTGDASESMNPLSNISTTNKDESSQFTSSLWDFLESIPASPAYASENPFLNKTQLKTSSHGHVNVVVTVNNDLAAKSMKFRENNKMKKNKSFFFLSIIGALCAVFWVCVGTVGVSRRSVLW